MFIRRLSGLLLAGLLLFLFASPLAAQEPKSAALVKELVTLLEQGKLDSVAALETKPDGYVAALYFPGVQLLVVAAKYKEPVLLNDKLAKKDYREIYMDLTSASMPGTKCMVMDMGCDGLKASGFDTYEVSDKQYTFNGDWKAQKLASEDEYQKAYGEADARYVRMLQALIAQVKKTS